MSDLEMERHQQLTGVKYDRDLGLGRYQSISVTQQTKSRDTVTITTAHIGAGIGITVTNETARNIAHDLLKIASHGASAVSNDPDTVAEHLRFIKTKGRLEGLQLAQQIIAGDMNIDEARERTGDMTSTGFLIQELDAELIALDQKTKGEQE